MTDRELLQQALDALELVTANMLDCRDQLAERGGRPTTNVVHQRLWDLAFTAYTDSAIPIAETLRARLAQPEPEPVAHSVIAGALFDFMGWLTSRKERIVLSSADNASPAVEVITEFAKMRGLSLDDAKVRDWNTAPPQREWQGLTDDEIWSDGSTMGLSEAGIRKFARAIEAKLKEKNT